MIKKYSRKNVSLITCSINKVSVGFYEKMGFEIEQGNKEVDEKTVIHDYDGPNQDRVLFRKKLV